MVMGCVLVALLTLMSMGSCSIPGPPENEVRTVINAIFSRQDPLRAIGADTSLLSAPLGSLVSRALDTETLDRERILRSEHPQDKPLLLEGEVFAGLYEGYTSFTVERVSIGKGDAKAEVLFVNGHYGIQWTDTLLLTHEGAWRLHDVRYGLGGGLQETLRAFAGQGQN